MSQLSDLILKQVTSAASGSNLGTNVLNGLTDSIVNSLKKTATSQGGVEQLISLFTGKTSAANSSVTALASQIFTSQFASKLGLSSSASSSATSLLPTIIASLVSIVMSKKSGGLDLSSILASLGASSGNSTASKLGYIAGTLGKLFKKK
ncbi:MAG: hypothetical protein J6T67_09175 [Paludibacteraceae bacterium]|nr:hypothetical protein [Paludibacteraceae bacterium]MBR4713060.1 hypothetical protein [Paludibacteraceae bacterium]MBR5374928.1 hypothetical protein [Paludibacteraceae bacterium]